jgi:hypothetical protein
MHSIPISYPVATAAAAATGWVARKIARAEGHSDNEAWRIGAVAGAAVGAVTAHAVSLSVGDFVGGHVAAAPHTAVLGHQLALATEQVPAIQIT